MVLDSKKPNGSCQRSTIGESIFEGGKAMVTSLIFVERKVGMIFCLFVCT